MPEMKSSFDATWVSGQQIYIAKGQAPIAGSWTVVVEARKNNVVIASTHTHISAK